jgi:hypothetical protein
VGNKCAYICGICNEIREKGAERCVGLEGRKYESRVLRDVWDWKDGNNSTVHNTTI